MKNPYLPQKAQITSIYQETASELDIKTFDIKFVDGGRLDFMPGQFVEVSLPGIGEAPFGFASSPLRRDAFEVTIKRVGLVTEAVHSLKTGSIVWVRGPFGNTFPMEEMEGSNILLVAGGLGLAPLRPLLLYVLDQRNRKRYGDVTMLLAARTPDDFIYQREYEEWKAVNGTTICRTIDRPHGEWQEAVGFPHDVLANMSFDNHNTHAVICGPPIMIKFVSDKLVEMGLPREKILTTLEMRMTCGVGKCGKCNIGHQYVCVDGPVFNLAQMSKMPREY